jgi:hypothetical protein
MMHVLSQPEQRSTLQDLSRRSETRPFPIVKTKQSKAQIRKGVMVACCQTLENTTLRLDLFVST